MPADRSTLVDAVVTLAKAKGGAGRGWLASELERVTLAMMKGAPTVKSLAMAGLNAVGENEMRTDELVEIFTHALRAYDDEFNPAAGAVLSPRFGACGIPY